ncbi:hypothetical protein JKP88DRAFT_245436 [Tribonema minus]|uniref:Uncharacterized protein n=1 Tax=Tribonema minus TaxID=303371 RepID=A0A835YW84_9STRA|nr:hypothetical protein JKP88DRAFT_245436 [Tribonema minus]
MASELHRRKLNNTRTSIALGSAPTVYETDAQGQLPAPMYATLHCGRYESQAHQKDILSSHSAGADREHNRLLKAQLTRTTFSLGDERVDYQRVSALPDPTGRLHEFTGVLNAEVKEMMKRSNMYFGEPGGNFAKGHVLRNPALLLRLPLPGNAAPSYDTAAHEGMQAVGASGVAAADMQATLQHNRDLKVALTRTNLNFGDEVPEYVSDYKRGFKYDADEVKSAGRACLSKEVKDDLRRSHFKFGTDPVVWETDARRNMRQAEQAEHSGPEEVARQREHNRLLKQSLQRTNYAIGTDADYM